MILPDINVLLHAAIEDDPLHGRAIDWLQSVHESPESLAIADVVYTGVVRIGSLVDLYGRRVEPIELIGFLDSLIDQTRASFVSAGRHHRRLLGQAISETNARGNLISDAHLVAIAAEYGCRIATRDSDFKQFQLVDSFDPFASDPHA